MKQFIKEVSAIFGGILLCLAFVSVISALFVFFVVEPADEKKCLKYQEQTGRETKREPFSSCYVQAKGTWYTLDEYKATITAKDLMTVEDGE